MFTRIKIKKFIPFFSNAVIILLFYKGTTHWTPCTIGWLRGWQKPLFPFFHKGIKGYTKHKNKGKGFKGKRVLSRKGFCKKFITDANIPISVILATIKIYLTGIPLKTKSKITPKLSISKTLDRIIRIWGATDVSIYFFFSGIMKGLLLMFFNLSMKYSLFFSEKTMLKNPSKKPANTINPSTIPNNLVFVSSLIVL